MVAEVLLRNDRGPSCSVKGTPGVVFSAAGFHKERTTTSERSEDFAETWVDLAWNPDGSYETRGALAHFRIYTTQADQAGQPCPADHLVVADQLNITINEVGTFYATGKPTKEGPQIRSCEGRIAVTSIAQLQ